MRERLGGRFQPIGVVFQAHVGASVFPSNGLYGLVALGARHGSATDNARLVIEKEVGGKVLHVVVVVLIRCIATAGSSGLLYLSEVHALRLERQGHTAHGRRQGSRAERLAELVGTLESDDKRRDLYPRHACRVILTEIQDVAHVGIGHRRALQDRALGAQRHRDALVHLAESGIHFLERARLLPIIVVVHHYLVAREAVALGQRQRQVVDYFCRLARGEHEASIRHADVVGVLLH